MSTNSSSQTSPSAALTPLPEVIQTYITAANEGRIDDAAACFTEDARVHDENHDHLGRAAIREWIATTTREYQPVNEVVSATAEGDTHAVTSKISGSFPGSPAELQFQYVITNGKISSLSIQ